MQLLPHWHITDKNPAFYDTESRTAIEQTARLYGAMQELINEYNAWVDKLNAQILEFEQSSEQDFEVFKTALRQEFQDFIDTVDLDLTAAKNYMRENLRESCKGLLDEISADAQAALASVTAISNSVDDRLSQQDATLNTQNSVIAGAVRNMETRINEQDALIAQAVDYMHTNLDSTIENKVAEMIENGSISMGLAHDESTEELTFHARNIEFDTDLSLGYDEGTETIYISET